MDLSRLTGGLRAGWRLGLAVGALALLAWSGTPCSGAGVRAAPAWEAPGGLLNTMTVHAQVRLPGGGYASAAGTLLAAFAGDSIRGVTTLFDGPAAPLQFQLSVGSDLGAEPGLTLRLYDAGSDTVYTLAGGFDFEAEGRIGLINLPMEYQALPNETVPVAVPLAVVAATAVTAPIRLAGTDAEGDPLTFRLDSAPAHGLLSEFDPATGDVLYTSSAGYTGADHLEFAVIDRGATWSAPARVTLTVQTMVLGVLNISGGNVATIEWGARQGASDGIDIGIDSPAAPGGMDGRSIAFVPPGDGTNLKRDVRGAFIGKRWQIAAQAGEAPLAITWDPAAQPPGNWYLWQLTAKNGAPVPGTAVRLAASSAVPAVPAWTARHFAIGTPAPMTLTAVAPNVAPPTGGTAVTLSGSGFTASTGVWFGSVAAASVVYVNATTLTAVAPAQARGAVPVSLTNPDGGSARRDAAFIYNLPPTAAAGGPYTVGVAEASALALDGAGSTSPYVGETLAYAWDLDQDGDHDDATGVAASVPWATLAALADAGVLALGQPSPISLRVTDSLGSTDTDTSTLTLADVAPWTFTLTVVSGGSAPQLTVGLRPDATDGIDAGIDIAAPAPAGAALTVLGGPGSGLLSDFRAYSPVTPTRYTGWVLRLTAGPGEPCVLSWDPLLAAAVGRGGLWLVQMRTAAGGAVPAADGRLLEGGLRLALATQSQLTIPAGQTVVLRLVFGYLEQTLTLAEGWNLFSLPIEPLDPTVASVLAVPGRRAAVADTVWVYDGARQAYLKAAKLHALQGAWAYVPTGTPTALHLAGIPVSDQDFPLAPGGTWQLAGVAQNRLLEANADLVPDVSAWDATAEAYRRLRPGSALESGLGYWFCVRSATTLNPALPR